MISRYTAAFFTVVGIAILFIGCSEIDNPVAIQEAHFEAAGLVLYEESAPILRIHKGETTFGPDTVAVPLGGMTLEWHILFLDEGGDELEPPRDPDKCLGWDIADSTVVRLLVHHPEEWAFQLEGLRAGITDIEIQILHESHPDFRTPRIHLHVQ